MRYSGLFTVKEELEEISFRYSDPDAYFDMKRRVDAILQEQKPVVLEVVRILENLLKADLYLQMRVGKIDVHMSHKAGLHALP